MPNLSIQEKFVDESDNCVYGETGIYETWATNTGELYRSLTKEYGPARKMFIDTEDGKTVQTGWVFTGNARYKDTGEKYKRSVQVTVYKSFKRVPAHITNVEYGF